QSADSGAAALGLGEAADHELLLPAALDLQPRPSAPVRVGRVAPLRDDALERVPARLVEELGAVADDVIAVRERRTAARADEAARHRLPALERDVPQVPPVEMEQVEDEVAQLPAVARLEGVLERVEAGRAVGQQDGDLAVENRAARRKRAGGRGDGG